MTCLFSPPCVTYADLDVDLYIDLDVDFDTDVELLLLPVVVALTFFSVEHNDDDSSYHGW